jgi:TonB family protein
MFGLTVVISLLVVVASGAAEPRPSNTLPEDVAGACPYGHERLVRLPLDPPRPPLPATVRRFEVICQQCGFRSVDPATEDHWIRDDSETASFEVPLHPLIRDFPVLALSGDAQPHYRQQVFEGELLREHVVYSTTEPSDTIVARLAAYFVAHEAETRIDENEGLWTLTVLEEGFDTNVSFQCHRQNACVVTAVRQRTSPDPRVRRSAGGQPLAHPGQRDLPPSSTSPSPSAAAALPTPSAPTEPRASIREPIRPDELPPGASFLAAEKRSAPMAQYSEEARKERLQGAVVAELHIDRRGNVVSVEIIQGCGNALDEIALEAFEKWRFKPARLDGSPVAVLRSFTINFSLQ